MASQPRWFMQVCVTVLLGVSLSSVYILQEHGQIHILQDFFLTNWDFLRPVLICIMVVIQNYKCICFQSSVIQKKMYSPFSGWWTDADRWQKGCLVSEEIGCAAGNMLSRLCYPNHLSTGIFLLCMMNTNANVAELDQKSIWLPWQCAAEGSVWSWVRSTQYCVLPQSLVACGSVFVVLSQRRNLCVWYHSGVTLINRRALGIFCRDELQS